MSCLKVCRVCDLLELMSYNSLLLVRLHLSNLYFAVLVILWVCLLFLIFLSLFCLEY